MSFDFWWRWLLGFSILFAVVGVILAIFPGAAFLALHTLQIERVFFDGAMTREAEDLRAFLLGPLGGTIAGYFLLQVFIVWGPFRRREPWSWHAVLWALLLWFVIDSSMSVRHGAVFNVWMVNIWTLLPIGLGLAMTYRYFLEGDRQVETNPP